MEEHDIFTPYFSPEPFPDSTILDHGSQFAPLGEENEPEPSSVTTRKQSIDDTSTVVDKIENGEQVTQNVGKKRKSRNGSSLNSDPSMNVVKGKGRKQRKTNNSGKKGEEKEAKIIDKKEGYIHVRARRGQATDSHSLAERIRREKISERMKTLQQLVPGCDKVSGKAVMLDEIINYVQSLQHQVEFLSMRMASLSPFVYEFGMDFDAFMFRPEQAPLPPLQQCSPPTQPTAFADTTTSFTLPNNSHLLDVSPSLLLQSQGYGNAIWDYMEMCSSPSFH